MKFKKPKQIKTIIALISSNLFLFLSITFSQNSASKNIIRKNYKTLLLPIEIFVPSEKGNDASPVALYDDLNNLLVKEAYIHFEDFKNPNFYKIEILEGDLPKIIKFKGGQLRAFPIIEESIKQGSENFEIIF